MADIFISYSSADKTMVADIAGLLEAKGWSVWWDRQIAIGQKYDTVIDNELQKAGCVLVIWTQKSVASEWVKNEALEAAQKNILVPVILEDVKLPVAFKRIESAMLTDWNGEDDHPELPGLYNSIEAILHPKNTIAPNGGNSGNDAAPIPVNRKALTLYSIMAVSGFILSLLILYYYLYALQGNIITGADQRRFYGLLVVFGIAVSALIFGSIHAYAALKGERYIKFTVAGPVAVALLVMLGGFLLAPKNIDKTITIRVSDWKKNPVTQGEVKIYLKEYIRTQSIDNMGQALFTGIPAQATRSKIKIEISSPGFTTKDFDTLLQNTGPLELVLPLTTVVFISGRIKTAAETPIKGVEVSVEGTRYYAVSITDGSYNLRLEEYTLGDEINITTSHPGFEDKTISLRISAPDIKNQDIFLNPARP